MCLDSVICALSVICLQMPALPKGEPRSRSEPHTCRIRLSLAQTCPRAAPSVTACAVPPSSERKAFSYAQSKLVSPFGRDVAQRQRGHCRLFFLADNFSIKKALRGVLFFYLFSWMCCRMLGCLRCCRCFPSFRCLLPHRSLRSVPNPHP